MTNLNLKAGKKKAFKVSSRVIWFSSLFMGVLASIPKILQLNLKATEIAVDCSIAFFFSLSVWYINIYNLPKFSAYHSTAVFFSRRLLLSLASGICLMSLLVAVHQLLFPHYAFNSMQLMYEFRGILINLTICMFLYFLYQSYYTQQISIELERSKADNLGAQYELLKQQVNPHFLFNSLNTLKSMVETADANSADFILKLSDFYRYTLESRKLDLITLSEELDILNAYIFLLKARFEDSIELINDIPQKYEQTYMPPFTLQLLIENAVKHNIMSHDQPLIIRIFVEDELLVIANPLQKKRVSETSTGMGLENINQRYLHLYKNPIQIETQGAYFAVKLPLIYEHRNY